MRKILLSVVALVGLSGSASAQHYTNSHQNWRGPNSNHQYLGAGYHRLNGIQYHESNIEAMNELYYRTRPKQRTGPTIGYPGFYYPTPMFQPQNNFYANPNWMNPNW